MLLNIEGTPKPAPVSNLQFKRQDAATRAILDQYFDLDLTTNPAKVTVTAKQDFSRNLLWQDDQGNNALYLTNVDIALPAGWVTVKMDYTKFGQKKTLEFNNIVGEHCINGNTYVSEEPIVEIGKPLASHVMPFTFTIEDAAGKVLAVYEYTYEFVLGDCSEI